MKNVYALLFLFSSVSLWAQETIYFRNPQYVLQMDKVMYPGYEIKFQNIELHEYLNNIKVSTTPLSDISTTREGNDISGDDFGSTLEFFYSAQLDKEYNIKSENFEAALMLGSNDINLTRLLPAKAENLADSLLSNYKKVEVTKRPVYDKKGRPIGTEATDVQVYERGYFDVRHNRVILAGRENAYRYIDNSQEIDGKNGILTLDTEHLMIDKYGYIEDDEEYLPRKFLGATVEFQDEFGGLFRIVKSDASFEDIVNDPRILEMTDLYGIKTSLQDVLDDGSSQADAYWVWQKDMIEKAWEYTEIGDELISPYTIKFVGVSSDNGVKSEGLPLVEQIIESRPLREDEVFDADGNVYETTLIGDRRWMKENLRSEHFQDGSEIPNLTTSQWATSTKEGIIIDEDIDVTLANKGHRYNGYTVVSEKNVCPYGFWVPDVDDIAELYNDVTPYNEYIKIKGSGTVKEFRYSPLLAPVVWPVATALNVAWNSIALGADITLLAGAGAIDLTYNTPWFLADLFLLGPILGWEKTNDKQYAKQMAPYRKKLYRIYKNRLAYDPLTGVPSIRISQEGYILDPSYRKLFLDKKGQPIRIQEQDYADAKMFELYEYDDGWEEWEDYEEIIDKPKYNPEWKNKNPKKGLKYNPLPTFKGNGGFHLFMGSGDLLSEVNGLFYYFRSAPYQPKSKDDYGEFENKIAYRGLPIKTKFRYLPVIAQLLKKDENLKDNYDFGLEVGNNIRFPRKQEPKSLRKSKQNIGLVYKHWGIPNMWGIHSKISGNHELNAAPSYYPEDDFKLLKMRTAIRCVNDPFYEAPSDKY